MKIQQKKCNPQLNARSFKERNPDLNIDEIQNNPNIPDDIKAELCGLNHAGDLAWSDDENGSMKNKCHSLKDSNGLPNAVHVSDVCVEQLIFDKYDEILNDESDDERRRRSRRSKKNEDDEWFATKRERMEKERKETGPRKTGRPKRKSDEGIRHRTAPKSRKKAGNSAAESTTGSDSASSPSETSGKPAIHAAAATLITKRPPNKKLPPQLPFDLTKKFDGTIPKLKSTTAAAALALPAGVNVADTNGSAINVKTVPSSAQSIAAMLSAGPGKHERKQSKTHIWRNNGAPPTPSPVLTNFMKPAITYPPERRRNGESEDDKAVVMKTIISGQYFKSTASGDGGGPMDGGGSGGSGASRSSNYVANISI